MDTIEFAKLITYLTKLTGFEFSSYDLREIQTRITPPGDHRNAGSVRQLISSIANGRKIEAIKEFRSLTGDGLKEAKDAVETVTNQMPGFYAQSA